MRQGASQALGLHVSPPNCVIPTKLCFPFLEKWKRRWENKQLSVEQKKTTREQTLFQNIELTVQFTSHSSLGTNGNHLIFYKICAFKI